jgi:poly-gamma-glutamate capsule biosynthesis protein CapA/YwtB (metallophosphatase superfamily)
VKPLLTRTLLVVGTLLLPAAAAEQEPRVSIAAVGDTMLGNTPQLPASPARYLGRVAPLIKRADIGFMNLEGALTSAGGGKCGGGNGGDCFAFRTPARFARSYRRSGFTVANSANNHYNDFGAAGQRDTDRALLRASIAQTGRPGQIAVLRQGELRVAFVGFAPYSWSANLLDEFAARRLIERAVAGSDVTVAYMHAGAEGAGKVHVPFGSEYAFGENRGNSRRFARMAVDAGADLVVGSGPHVLRGVELYRHRLIAYSLGNFAGYHNFGSSGRTALSAALKVTLSASGRPLRAQLFPLVLSATGRPSRGGPALGLMRTLSRADFGARAAPIAGDGTIALP